MHDEGKGRSAGSLDIARRMVELTRVPRRAVMVAFDVLAWFLAFVITSLLAFVDSTSAFEMRAVVVGALAAGLLQTSVGVATGLYRSGWRVGSAEEATRLLRTVPVATVLLALGLLATTGSRRQVVAALLAGPLAAVVQLGIRLIIRTTSEREGRHHGEHPTLIYGGEAAQRVIDAMRVRGSEFRPVGIIEDDPRLAHLRIRSVAVLGTLDDLARIVEATGATHLVLATPTASSDAVHDVARLGVDLGLGVLRLPPVTQMFDSVQTDDLEPISHRDLLGRDEVRTGLADISDYLSGKRVLVTGAAGSIGSELCRQIRRFGPASLTMLDTDDTGLQQLQLQLDGHGLLDDRSLVLASVRDPERLAAVFDRIRPEVVFHTAALKHLPLLEQHPDEGFKTNVLGTLNVVEAAVAHGAERIVNVSTDKAADPSSVLGRTKRLGERLVSTIARGEPGVTMISVRFGNVLGSRGSMLPTFRTQIAEGGPVTVTHPDATRFFMTIEEACGLVIDAGAVGASGEVLVLDMGDPVRIADIATRLAGEASPPVEVVFTGLRPGEKLHEVLISDAEQERRPRHPLISHVEVPPLELPAVEALRCGIELDPEDARPVEPTDFLTYRQEAG